jgi:hypothetical protein
MGQFNDTLLEDLALTVDPQNDDSMEVYGKLGKLGFNVDGLEDIHIFRNALFKLFMLRAKAQYEAKNEGKMNPRDRYVTVSLTLNLRSPTFHSDTQLVEHGTATDLEDARKLRDIIPVINGQPGDTAQIDHILDLINNGAITLACN